MTRARAALALVAFLVLTAGPGALPRLHAQTPLATRVHRFLMGTSMTIEASGGDPVSRAAAIDEAFAAMAEVDRLMSNYRADSELTQVNQRAAREPVPVSDALFSVLSAAQMVSEKSGGAFDVTVGPLMRLWGFFTRQGHVPSTAELEAVKPLIGSRQMLLDARARTVQFTRAGVEIDLGGIAKGFAVELAGGVLKRHGLSGFVDAGGNQYFVGTPIGKSRWQVGIEDPDTQGRLLGVLDVPGGAVATSGGYHNFFTVNGTRYGHIIDPRTLQPTERSLSVTVVSADATLADALTKPAFILGANEGLALVESFPNTQAIIAARKPGGGVSLTMSNGLKGAFAPSPKRP
jgi:thiamine biosynthesis lipoprotein